MIKTFGKQLYSQSERYVKELKAICYKDILQFYKKKQKQIIQEPDKHKKKEQNFPPHWRKQTSEDDTCKCHLDL